MMKTKAVNANTGPSDNCIHQTWRSIPSIDCTESEIAKHCNIATLIVKTPCTHPKQCRPVHI